MCGWNSLFGVYNNHRYVCTAAHGIQSSDIIQQTYDGGICEQPYDEAQGSFAHLQLCTMV